MGSAAIRSVTPRPSDSHNAGSNCSQHVVGGHNHTTGNASNAETGQTVPQGPKTHEVTLLPILFFTEPKNAQSNNMSLGVSSDKKDQHVASPVVPGDEFSVGLDADGNIVNAEPQSTYNSHWVRQASRNEVSDSFEGRNSDGHISNQQSFQKDGRCEGLLHKRRSNEFHRTGPRVCLGSSLSATEMHHNSKIGSLSSILQRGSSTRHVRSAGTSGVFLSSEDGWNEDDNNPAMIKTPSLKCLQETENVVVALEDAEEKERQRIIKLIEEMKEHKLQLISTISSAFSPPCE
ncbi:hypothetical protein TcG_09165 [Trypanosoma cruzi]|uniref:Uncharacterized protein n=1 Tax=Trypanosoma cruzi Dm28c TaxID=1416333 RepID=V5ALT1_TRYCR|nr:hypothetical protein TCDM_10745 [Trypanosoma cruzi Dm28c]PBJ74580.1 hypothetical protein BCY84_12355 [Trypanosoma cruzi cruzi]PBJ74614.1 orthology [Trypanosoma cruzi cruzi]PBJ81424.1 hypothetical protein BCY84_00084 [Trypanosoma cruzi cruzi]RNF11283.1 hypothetical protein TcG_09165 [Trypanosoma cruzi]